MKTVSLWSRSQICLEPPFLSGAGADPIWLVAIGSYNRRLFLAPNLYGGEERQISNVGDFFTVADGRMGGPASPLHAVLERRGRAERSAGECLVLLLGDQALPANLPRGQDSGCCVGVIRREYAALDHLIDTFMDVVKYHSLPAGSVIVISSASQLASEGTADYARALVDAASLVDSSFDGEVELVPGPIYLLGGTVYSSLLKSYGELVAWVKSMKGAGGVLKATMQRSWEVICRAGRGVSMLAGGFSVRLPTEIAGRTDRVLWDLLPQEPVPTSCRGLVEDEEQEILNSME